MLTTTVYPLFTWAGCGRKVTEVVFAGAAIAESAVFDRDFALGETFLVVLLPVVPVLAAALTVVAALSPAAVM